ncbi:DUF6463 family protein [Parvularcula lutaonensis]|uniref:DUF6463 family protein n=1 Tax=Parvularcula lutaonensis TaxID=491923 RepID=A0ABV7ME72_9PROT|nr:DUF6463 family protein [Parvularcula lutaonensis]GGY52090.1 hypothetical protein GCM10007148_21420 [Parvularcula lutaonensis]
MSSHPAPSLKDRFDRQRMLKLAGPVLMAEAVGHAALGYLIHQEDFAALSGGEDLNPAVFWFTLFSAMLLVIGWLVTASHLKTGSVPGRRVAGALLIAIPVAAGVARALTPLWMLIVPGVMLLFGRSTPKLTDEKSGRKLR